MRNIISYVEETKETLAEKPLGNVDSLVLSQLSYPRYGGYVPRVDEPLAKTPLRVGNLARIARSESLYDNLRAGDDNAKLFSVLAESPRFRDVQILYYADQFDVDAEKQFSAVTFLLGDGSAYVAFRGTDATVVGWKEDMNMSFMPTVPSQQEGVAYLNIIGERVQAPLHVGGHSKGGNIAVYAAAHCNPDIQRRILRATSHDGPGFREEFFRSEGFSRIQNRVYKTVPQSSIIGMLLQHQEDYAVVRSRGVGITQHDPFSWLVEQGDFRYEQGVTRSAEFTDLTLNGWATSVPEDTRREFINTLYDIIRVTGAHSIDDLSADWLKNATAVLTAVKGMAPETRRFILLTVKSLFVLAVRNIGGMLRRDEGTRGTPSPEPPA